MTVSEKVSPMDHGQSDEGQNSANVYCYLATNTGSCIMSPNTKFLMAIESRHQVTIESEMKDGSINSQTIAAGQTESAPSSMGVSMTYQSRFSSGSVWLTFQRFDSGQIGIKKIRVYNNDFDTTVYVEVVASQTGGYTFTPSIVNTTLTAPDFAKIQYIAQTPFTSITVLDEFVTTIFTYSSRVDIYPKHVGKTFVRFLNAELDTLIPVNILPVYTTYDDPILDFDDTKDSFDVKYSLWTGNYTPYAGTDSAKLVYQNYQGSVHPCSLTAWFDATGHLCRYEVALTGVSVSEIRNYLEERYKKWSANNQGHYYYTKGFNVSVPGVNESSVVVVEHADEGKIIYYKPSSFSSLHYE